MTKVLVRDLIKSITEQEEAGKILLKDLSLGDKVTVVTKKSSYLLEIEKDNLKITTTNPKYPDTYTGELIGTTVVVGSSTISMGSLALGGSLEVFIDEIDNKPSILRTSEVREVHVNGIKVLPKSEILS